MGFWSSVGSAISSAARSVGSAVSSVGRGISSAASAVWIQQKVQLEKLLIGWQMKLKTLLAR